MNDFLKDEEEWQRQLRNAEGQVQRLCHCGERAHFGQPNNTWVCREHSRFASQKAQAGDPEEPVLWEEDSNAQ